MAPEALHRPAGLLEQVADRAACRRWRCLGLRRLHGARDRAEQGTSFGRQGAGVLAQLLQPFAAEQLVQQAGAGGVERAEFAAVDLAVCRQRRLQGLQLLRQRAMVGQGPVAAQPQAGGARHRGELELPWAGI